MTEKWTFHTEAKTNQLGQVVYTAIVDQEAGQVGIVHDAETAEWIVQLMNLNQPTGKGESCQKQ